MANVEVLKRRADEVLREASKMTDRNRMRSLLVKAHDYLKSADETEAQQLSARGAAAERSVNPARD